MAKHIHSRGARPSRTTRVGLAIAFAALITDGAAAAAQPSASASCEPGSLVRMPDLQEGSGVAVTRSGRIWTHNDSGQPVLMVLDQRGAIAGKVQLAGVRVEDWEAIAAGPCPNGSCLYVGDIGDNDGERGRITVYRLPEPDRSASSATVADVFHATYSDGPRDAETLLVTPQGEMFVVTKGPVALYRFPRDAKPGATVQLERVGEPRAGKVTAGDRITDGAVSPDGQWVVLRSSVALHVDRAAEFLAGRWQERGRIDLRSVGEPQGEGVAFIDQTTLVAVGEGGGKKQPGTFSRLNCTF